MLILITVIVFFPTFTNDFQTGWDDTWQVLENPYVLDYSLGNLWYHFTNSYHGQYSPINTLVLIVIHKLFDFNAVAFHITFLIFHIFNVVLIFYILKDILNILAPKIKPNDIQLYVALVSLIFAIHPLQVESVAWISASKIILYTFFFFLALWYYIKYIHSNKTIWLFITAIVYALSFGSKEQAIILPLNLLVLDYIYGRFNHLKLNKALLKTRVLLEKIPFFLLALGFWYFSSQFNLVSVIAENNYPLSQRLFFSMHSVAEYIFRSIAPVKLYYFYFFPMKIGEELPLIYWKYLVLTIIIIGFIWSKYKQKNKLVLFGFSFFIINILLVLHLLPMPREMITADRYMYVSIIGLGLIGIWYYRLLLDRFYKYKNVLYTLGIFYIFALGFQSHYRTKEWKNSDTMKKNVYDIVEKRKALKQFIINNPLINENDK